MLGITYVDICYHGSKRPVLECFITHWGWTALDIRPLSLRLWLVKLSPSWDKCCTLMSLKHKISNVVSLNGLFKGLVHLNFHNYISWQNIVPRGIDLGVPLGTIVKLPRMCRPSKRGPKARWQLIKEVTKDSSINIQRNAGIFLTFTDGPSVKVSYHNSTVW